MPNVAEAIFELNESEKEDYNRMKKWGNSRSKAANNFYIHFSSPCETCLKNYAELISDYIVMRTEEEGLEDMTDEKMQELMKEAHLHYLGNPEIEKLGLRYSLDHILANEN